MTNERIQQVISEIEKLEDEVDESHNLSMPFVCRSYVGPKAKWDRRELELVLKITLPQDMVEFWNITSGIRLYEDVNYGQWGLIIGSPIETLKHHENVVSNPSRKEDFLFGDLVFGRFLGDSEFPLIRCDPKSPDYGSVMISLPMDVRKDWFSVASSFTEFLENFIASPDTKYWERR
jgi:hypothetical protein